MDVQTEHSRLQMGEWMWGEEEREALWSGEVEHGTSREGDLEGGGGGGGVETWSIFLIGELFYDVKLLGFL